MSGHILIAGVLALLLSLAGKRPFESRYLIYWLLLLLFVDFNSTILTKGNTQNLQQYSLWLFGVFSLVLIGVRLIRKHVQVVVSVVFGTMTVTTLIMMLLGTGSVASPSGTGERSSDPLQSPQGVFVHIVLDEHLGIEGFPDDIERGPETRDLLTELFEDYGFLLFGGAYSEYFNTENSLPAMFNGASLGDLDAVRSLAAEHNSFLQNAYFEHLIARGYALNVLQTSLLDFCPADLAAEMDCSIYRYDVIPWSRLVEADLTERLYLIGKNWIQRSDIIKTAMRLIGTRLDWDGQVSPIASQYAFERFIGQVADSKAGEFHFAHLLFPHYPYIYNSDCQIQPRPWLNQWGGTGPDRTRAIRNARYFGQVTCSVHMLRRLFDAMKSNGTLENATIVVHGDHGSRIVPTDPAKDGKDMLNSEDMTASFSTLFAVRAPGQQPGYDARQISLRELMTAFTKGPSTIDELVPGSPHVYLAGDSDSLRRFPLPSFSAPLQERPNKD